MGKMKVQYCGADTALVPAIVTAILDMLFSIMILGVLSYVAYMLNHPTELEKVVQRIDPERTGNLANFLTQTSGEQTMMLIIPFVSSILGFLMGIFLIISSIKKYLNALRIWFILTMIFMILQMIIFIIQITNGRNSAVFIVPGIFEYLYRIYALWVVRCFIREVMAVKSEETSEEEGSSTPTPAEEAEAEAE